MLSKLVLYAYLGQNVGYIQHYEIPIYNFSYLVRSS